MTDFHLFRLKKQEVTMDVTGLVSFLLIGLVAGWIAGNLMKGRGLGLVGNLIVGVIGAFLGGLLFDFLDIYAGGLIGAIITATAGAVVLLFLMSFVKKA